MDVEGCWNFIKSKLQEGIDLFIPIKICTDKVKDKPPWMSHHVKKNVKKKYLLFKRFIDSDSSTDYKEYIKMRNDVTKLIKRSKILHEKKVASQSKKNPKSFWKHVNSFRKCRENVSALQREDGSLATSDQEKADMLIKFFSSVLTVEDMTNIPHIPWRKLEWRVCDKGKHNRAPSQREIKESGSKQVTRTRQDLPPNIEGTK